MQHYVTSNTVGEGGVQRELFYWESCEPYLAGSKAFLSCQQAFPHISMVFTFRNEDAYQPAPWAHLYIFKEKHSPRQYNASKRNPALTQALDASARPALPKVFSNSEGLYCLLANFGISGLDFQS